MVSTKHMRWKTIIVFALLTIFCIVPCATAEDANNSTDLIQQTKSIDTQSTVTQQDSSPTLNVDNIRPVPPEEFAGKFNKVIMGLIEALSIIIVPLAMLSMLISVIALSVGALIGRKSVTAFGVGGFLCACAALFIFWGMPLIIGLIQSLAASFAS
jgi:hypothetical protein